MDNARVQQQVKRRKSDVRQRQANVSVRLLPEERQRVQTAADARGVSVAELLRQALLRDLGSRCTC